MQNTKHQESQSMYHRLENKRRLINICEHDFSSSFGQELIWSNNNGNKLQINGIILRYLQNTKSVCLCHTYTTFFIRKRGRL